MNKKIITAGFIVSSLLLINSLAWSRFSKSDLEDRIEQLENKINSNLNLEIANKLEELQREVQELRGMIEEQKHAEASVGASLEQTAYNTAHKLVEEKKFIEAINEFKDFLLKYNTSKNVADANYWLGELYLTEHEFDVASGYFLEVINKHKNHTKAPDALLKLGMLELERKNWSEAKNYFNKIKTDYINSSRVHMAEAKLQELERQGH
jgi:tol-pal system protein YbgF